MVVAIVTLLVATTVGTAVKIAAAWERAVVLRLGRVPRAPRAGALRIIPIIDTVPYWIDIRVITSSFKAEKTLTKDTVPVDVDAVLFWKVVDPEKAALAVADYASAISWAAQTALRDVIGKTHARRHARGSREDLGSSCSGSSTRAPSRGAST